AVDVGTESVLVLAVPLVQVASGEDVVDGEADTREEVADQRFMVEPLEEGIEVDRPGGRRLLAEEILPVPGANSFGGDVVPVGERPIEPVAELPERFVRPSPEVLDELEERGRIDFLEVQLQEVPVLEPEAASGRVPAPNELAQGLRHQRTDPLARLPRRLPAAVVELRPQQIAELVVA